MTSGEYLTQEKYEELVKELEYLKKEKRKEVAENLEYAKSLGDLSENAEYHEAREAQAKLEDRILRIEAMIKTAVLVSDQHGEVAGIGSTIVVRRESDKKTMTYKLVGSAEADISAGKLSVQSPLGEAIINKRKGEAFSFKSPQGLVKYTIVEVK